jgi:hypothetical protein
VSRHDSLAFARHDESNFSVDGRMPSSAEAERFFGAGDYSLASFGNNDSRLSLGFGHQTPTGRSRHGSVGRLLPQTPVQNAYQVLPPHMEQPHPMYETLSHYKTGWPQSHAQPPPPPPPLPEGNHHVGQRRDPPPLPPKPRLSGVRPSVGSEADLPVFAHGHHQPQPRQSVGEQLPRGYSVSFV